MPPRTLSPSLSRCLHRFGQRSLVLVASGLMVATVAVATTALPMQVVQGQCSNRESEPERLCGSGVRRWVGLTIPVAVIAAERLPLLEKMPLVAQGNASDKANQLFKQGYQLFQEGSTNSLQQAIPLLEGARKLYHEFGQREGEATCLLGIGRIYSDLGENQRALENYNQALQLFRAANDRSGEAITLNNIGLVYSDLGEKQQALEYYNRALPLRRAVNDRSGEASTLNNTGLVYSDLGENQQALDVYNRALLLSRAVNDRNEEATSLLGIGSVYSNLGKKQQALEYLNRALPLFQTDSDRRGEASTLNNIGTVYSDLGEKQRALEYLNRALPLSRAVGDRSGEAASLNNIGRVYSDLGEKQRALDAYNQALLLLKAVSNRAGEATTLNNIGSIYSDLGEPQQALDNYNQALLLSRGVSNRAIEATTLNNIGNIYSELGEPQQALDNYNQALLLSRAIDSRTVQATTLINVGTVYSESDEPKQALTYYNQALPLLRAVGNRTAEAITLTGIGLIYHNSLGDTQRALENYNRALLLSRAVGDRTSEATTLNNIGLVYGNLGEPQRALAYYNKAVLLSQTVGNRKGEATMRSNIAGVYRRQGKLAESLTQINTTISIVEKLRGNLRSDNLKTSYFVTVQDFYRFKIEVLMELHRQQPQKGYDIQALETSEQSRARVLRELLVEANANIDKDIDPELRKQKSELQQKLDAGEKELIRLSSNKETQAQVANAQANFQVLQKQEDQLRNEIREKSPAYAALWNYCKPDEDRKSFAGAAPKSYCKPLDLKGIQQQLDDNTLLLQYSLGEDRSYLWAVTKTGELKSYTLLGRANIEEVANRFYSALSSSECDPKDPANCNPTDATRTGKDLYQLILAKATDQLQGKKRLLIVGDGALQYIPFAALPLPNAKTYVPLITEHEIVHAPSISALAILREQFGTRPPAPKLLAAIADPVFSLNQVRDRPSSSNSTRATRTEASVTTTTRQSAESFAVELDRSAVERSLSDCGLNFQNIQPLPFTRTASEQILVSIADPQKTTHRYGLEANLDWVTQSELSRLNDYQTVLFATHGCANSVKPELSGILLSLVDEKGQSRRGFLRLGDIFNLDLSAELVVLSACQTGLGKDIRGEGLVGLTRGFMYAGAKRVVASLWNISAEEPTADLLTNFFNEIQPKHQKASLPPAAALRATQIAMWKKYRDPYYWAAFTLQGEWR